MPRAICPQPSGTLLASGKVSQWVLLWWLFGCLGRWVDSLGREKKGGGTGGGVEVRRWGLRRSEVNDS